MGKITLQTPLQRDKEKVTEISLRKPKAGEMRGLQLTMILQMDVATLQKLLPRVTEPALTPAELDQMDIDDFSALAFEVLGFFGGSMREAMGAMTG